MRARNAIPVLLVFAVAFEAPASRLTTDAAGLDRFGEKPITKVVNLLKDMQTQLDEEGKEDQEMFDKLTCWCETNDKEKTKAIADGQQKIVELQATIEEAVATSATLSSDITALESDIATLAKALDEAAELRAKESAEFAEEEKDMMASAESLKGAVTALGKSQGGSALAQREALLQVSQVLRRRPSEAVAAAAPHQRSQVRQLLSMSGPGAEISLMQQSTRLRSGAPASGAIFGMLSQMKETFEANLATGQKEEAQSQGEYETLKGAKKSQIDAATTKVATKKDELAKADELAARSKQDLKDTTNSVAADSEFLGNLKKQCGDIDAQFEERTKARLEEITAVGETIGILTSDEAQQSFSKSSSLLQLRAQSKRETTRREATARYLAEAGKRLKSPRLSFLAVRVQGDAFAKIKENIDKMVGQLDKDGKDEETHKTNCNTDLKANTDQTGERSKHKADVETEIADLDAEISALTDESKKLTVQISDARIEIKQAGENRELENKDFQTTVADQRATAAIVKKAMERMEAFYGKTAFLEANDAQTPPGSFGTMKKNGGGQGVIMLLENVIREAVDVEKDATEAENKAQAAYETFVADTNKMIEEASRQLTNLKETIGTDSKTEVEDKGDVRHTEGDLRGLEGVADTLHDGCDWDLAHFDERVAARKDEQEALKNSKAIFSGANMLLQTDSNPDMEDTE